MVEDPIPAPPIPDVDADFKVWVTATIVWTDVLQFNLESTVVGGTGTHTYEWYLGTSVTPVTTPNAYVEFVADISEIDKIKFRLIVTDEDGRAINIRVALSYTEG